MNPRVWYRGAILALVFVGVCHWPVPAQALSEACQSLAAVYARNPEYLDAKELVALQRCLALEVKEKSQSADPPPPRDRGPWPPPAPWTPTPESWPSPNPW
jgi:hypothetical protein